ncbi:putative disease resistance protein RGA3 [Oryza brachyantha]|nr:putative disease resistance protein RGA3 [Oryza brachyantha]
MRPEDMGIRYLNDLRSRFLFQTDPKLPDQNRYVMHDLIHDMAQSVSADECLLLQDLSSQNNGGMLHTVRHMSVEVADESLEREIRGVRDLNKLHSLRFGAKLKVEITWFSKLSNILFLSLKGCRLVKLPESIGDLHSLRYLDISHSRVQELPEKFWQLYNLQVVDATRSSLKAISNDVTKLINLPHLALPKGCSPKLTDICGLGNLSHLRKLEHFTVGKGNGRKIGELKGMNQLSGKLTIRNIQNVESKEEAAAARLVDKKHLQELVLLWRWRPVSRAVTSENGVVEGLCPPPRIQRLKIANFEGDSFSPSWFKPESLPTLRSLELDGCHGLTSLSIPSFRSLKQLKLTDLGIETLSTFAHSIGGDRTMQHESSSISSSNIGIAFLRGLTSIRLSHCQKLRNVDQLLSPEYVPSIKSIWITHCPSLVSIPTESFGGFDHLQDLKIMWCNNLACERAIVLPPSLRRLHMGRSGDLDKSFPACLQNRNLTSLIALRLESCSNMESIPIGTNLQLKYLHLGFCSELSSIRGSEALSSMQYAYVLNCSKLLEVEQPFTRDLLTKEEKDEYNRFSCPANTRPRRRDIVEELIKRDFYGV